jgi:hypothetical protein
MRRRSPSDGRPEVLNRALVIDVRYRPIRNCDCARRYKRTSQISAMTEQFVVE